MIAAATAVVAGASLLPWYRSGWAVGADGYDTWSASAWEASTVWSIAVGLGLLAGLAGLWLAGRPGPLRFAPAVLALAGLALAVWGWWRIPVVDLSDVEAGWTEAPTLEVDTPFGQLLRDNLVRLHIDGLDFDVAWGLYAGLAALALLTVTLVVRPLWKVKVSAAETVPAS
jgi:hypothetical protein